MTVDATLPCSPLDAHADRLTRAGRAAGLRVAELRHRTQLAVRVRPRSAAAHALARALGAPLPMGPSATASAAGVDVLWLGPDEWLVIAEAGAMAPAAALERAAGPEATVVDVSAQRRIVELAGATSGDVLAQGCALDLHPRAFVPETCAQTLLARTGAILVRRRGDEPSWWIIVRASFAEYLAEWLIDVAAGCAQPATLHPERLGAAA